VTHLGISAAQAFENRQVRGGKRQHAHTLP
jgi:hypothetical protein